MSKRVLQIMNLDTFRHNGEIMKFTNLDNIDISEFKKNGVILDTHNDKSTDAVLGTVLKMTKTKDGRLYIKDIKWSPSAGKQEADYNEGILKAASVRVVNAVSKRRPDGTIEILSGVLKEVSLCPIGANPTAVSEIADIEGIDYQFSYANINKDENMDINEEVKEEVLETEINLSINTEEDVQINDFSFQLEEKENEITNLKLQLSEHVTEFNDIKLQLQSKDNEISVLKGELTNIKKEKENAILHSILKTKVKEDKIEDAKSFYFSMDFEHAKTALSFLPDLTENVIKDIKLSNIEEDLSNIEVKNYKWYITNGKMSDFLKLDETTQQLLRIEYNKK